jgi:hypothetical protein
MIAMTDAAALGCLGLLMFWSAIAALMCLALAQIAGRSDRALEAGLAVEAFACDELADEDPDADDADRLVLVEQARDREDREVAVLDDLWALPAREPSR